VDDWCVDTTVAAILHASSTGDAGQVGDCKVYVMPWDTYVASGAVHGDSGEGACPYKMQGARDEPPDTMATEPEPRFSTDSL
jgi:hypothetical protein